MQKPSRFPFLSIGMVVLCLMTTTGTTHARRATQSLDLEQAVGKWRSTERFENDARITVGLRSKGGSVEDWAVLLGQHRKTDDRATLALSFCNATWDGRRLLFSTVLPEDEGTTGWELRVTTSTTAVLAALTEDGQPIPDAPKWNMIR
jgi:hypothetical protein